ncbi:hypothetical protein SLEP1_g37105 [Rubroshorea leprosula]|uniref:Uncharacterized protein n=1 Tax=Rubroshorea leprosula TaxID=152421 RepID=A0AAV5KU00_9ROSI|nr:hypothetical protein SLEP1_g37105 [Rubroshorea leprosula]
MDEIWERAVETALNEQKDYAATRTLTLDGSVKVVPGRLPLLSLLEKFENLQYLSMANNRVPSLEHFSRLRDLHKLILSDNRIECNKRQSIPLSKRNPGQTKSRA